MGAIVGDTFFGFSSDTYSINSAHVTDEANNLPGIGSVIHGTVVDEQVMKN